MRNQDPMPSVCTTKKFDDFPSEDNRLVSALSRPDRKFFSMNSSVVSMPSRKVLMEPGDAPEFCYFPCSGILSLVALMSSGTGAEIGLVGSEGMVSVNVLLGARNQQHQVLVQGAGHAYRIPSAQLISLCQKSEHARSLLLHYVNGFFAFIGQAAACNALHGAEARLARWILLASDRMRSDNFEITHEFIAEMLGTRRATVTVVANQLEEAGSIRLGRREITILDRAALLRTSCECYHIMTKATSFEI